jgi:GNAT superfamily N-acetyltransferase
MTKHELKQLIVEEIQSLGFEPSEKNTQSTVVFTHPALTLDYKEDGEYIRLNKLKVKELFRGRGIGTKALRSILSLAKSKGKSVLVPWLNGDFDSKDTQVRRFFEKNGFVNRGENLIWKP